MFDLTNPIFSDDDKAREHLESIMWPDGPYCPHCGEAEKITKLKGKSHRPGLHQCNSCHGHFTVTVGTVLERSKIPLRKWVLGFHLMSASKKGISAHQLHRMLGITYKSAWFMAHRIREALKPAADASPLGGPGKIVEIDETYIGGKEKNKHRSRRHSGVGGVGKAIVHTLVERGGPVRSRRVANVNSKTLRPILVSQVSRKSTLMTDDGGQNRVLGREFARHESVNHSIEEYVRGDAHVNTAENYFSILKRGIVGVYHHVSEAHLHRYTTEFDFRYSHRSGLGYDDSARTLAALKGIAGKRLTYRRPREARYV